MQVPPRLELRSVSKRYHGTVANDAVSLSLEPGEIHALLGENGAGKSTLMKILYGAVEADAGEILWEGRPVRIGSPAVARQLGIGMVYQHFSLFESVTVAENIALALDEPFDLGALRGRIGALGERYGLHVDPERLLHHLSVGERQRVEILRCLLQSPRLLVLDEPTAVLTPQEAQALFAVLRRLASEGCSIIYISHRLEEIRDLCDRATILRAGRVVGSADPRTASPADLARLMVGSDIAPVVRVAPCPSPAPLLELCSLTLHPADPFGTPLDGVSLQVHGGEIVGIAGVAGNGQAELLAALCGERRTAPSSLRLGGDDAGHLGVAARRARGFAYVPEDRLGTGAAPSLSLADNGLLTAHRTGLVRHGLIDPVRRDRFADGVISAYDVRCSGPGASARELSGGNLQKFIMGRELSQEPRVLVVAQPTWGVDVAAAAFLRQRLMSISRRGTAVLVFSEELDELFEICDRIGVIHAGRLSAPEPVQGLQRATIGLRMTGS